jgi:hypothetical protein
MTVSPADADGRRDGELSAAGVPRSGSPRWARVSLLVLLAVCGALRLLYASADLGYGRFYDEKFSLQNVDSAIRSGTLRPANAFYPSLSYLPQTALVAASHGIHRLTGWDRARVLGDRPGVMTPTAFLLSRFVQWLYGLGVIVLTYTAGRRLFDPSTGLLAALLVAVMPNQIRLSAFFKPDILVTLLVLAAFLFTLEAAREPSRWRVVLVGVAVGLATAAKYTGVAAALPLVVLVLVRGARDRRLVWWSTQAAVASVATFVVVNPHLQPVLEFLPRLGGIYESKGSVAGVSHLGMLGEAIEIVLSPAQHGPVLGFVALCGIAALAVRACNRREEPRRRVELALALAVPIGFVVVYAAASTLPKVNNYLPITPFTALAAAFALRGAWAFASARLVPPAWRRRTALALAAALALWLLPPAAALSLDPVVPTTVERAQALLERELKPFYLRSVYVEPGAELGVERLRLVDVHGNAMWRLVPSLAGVGDERLDAADAEIFVFDRGGAADAAAREEARYRARRERLPAARAHELDPRPFRLRGPSLALLLHPWHLRGDPVEVVAERSAEEPFVASLLLPLEVQAGELVSLSVWLPRAPGVARELEVRTADGRVLETVRTRARRRQGIHQTERFEVVEPGSSIEIQLPEHLPRDLRPRVEIWRWLPTPEGPSGATS